MNKKNKLLFNKIKRYKMIYFMLLPIVIYFIMFSYYPLLLGVKMSLFESKLLGGGKFVYLKNYKEVLNNPMYLNALVNTLVVCIGNLIGSLSFGIVIALCINEVKNLLCKSALRTVTYLPSLLSWAIVGGLWIKILAPNGLLHSLIDTFAPATNTSIALMADERYIRIILILTTSWKNAGYYVILLLAAIVTIDPGIYEAAQIDGASRLRQLFSMTFPNLVPTLKILVVLGSMGVLSNFDQIFIMANSSTYDKARNLLFLIYQQGIISYKTGYATAAATLVFILTFVIAFIVRKLVRYDKNYI